MQDITIGRFDKDPEAQGVIKPKDGSWQLVIGKDGVPHLWLRCRVALNETEVTDGWTCLDDYLPKDLSMDAIMNGEFGGPFPSFEEEQRAIEEYSERHMNIPCPR